jgi:azaphilone biosynthesis cytochrome P450 monooxygenase
MNIRAAYQLNDWVKPVCIGNSLALMEIRLATTLFFRKFPRVQMSPKKGMNDRDLSQEQYLIMAPRGHRLLVEA